MDLKLFGSTFALIFLAELGDKTQLAALARSATGDKWTVFFGASAALVVSTFVAVLFGAALTRLVPPVYVRAAAGVLFLIFGALILYGAFHPEAEKAVAVVPAPAGGLLARLVLATAAQFERASEEDYLRLAAATTEPQLKPLLTALAAEERAHLAQIRAAGESHGEAVLAPAVPSTLPQLADLAHDVADAARPLLEHAIEHELTTAAFYDELARVTVVPGLRTTFAVLAAEEREHARRLRAAAPQQVG